MSRTACTNEVIVRGGRFLLTLLGVFSLLAAAELAVGTVEAMAQACTTANSNTTFCMSSGGASGASIFDTGTTANYISGNAVGDGAVGVVIWGG